MTVPKNPPPRRILPNDARRKENRDRKAELLAKTAINGETISTDKETSQMNTNELSSEFPHHLSRDNETRGVIDAYEDRDTWEPSLFTTAPPARPDMEQLWVRTRLLGVDDHQNVAKHVMQGWTPRMASTAPAQWQLLSVTYGNYGSVIGNPDSILMERPKWKGDKVREMLARQEEARLKGIRQYVKGRMPTAHGAKGGDVTTFDMKVLKGRQPTVEDD